MGAKSARITKIVDVYFLFFCYVGYRVFWSLLPTRNVRLIALPMIENVFAIATLSRLFSLIPNPHVNMVAMMRWCKLSLFFCIEKSNKKINANIQSHIDLQSREIFYWKWCKYVERIWFVAQKREREKIFIVKRYTNRQNPREDCAIFKIKGAEYTIKPHKTVIKFRCKIDKNLNNHILAGGWWTKSALSNRKYVAYSISNAAL